MTMPNAPQDRYTTAEEERARLRANAGAAERQAWRSKLPLIIGALVLLGIVLYFSISRDCANVDGARYQSDSARTAAFERGDTLRADDPRQGTDAAARACGRR